MEKIFETLREMAHARKIIQFNKNEALPIEDCEGYAETGMRARLIGVYKGGDEDCIEIKVDFSEFEDFNKGFESSNYYDKSGQACLSAREAGFYKPVDNYFIDTKSALTLIAVVDDWRGRLFEEWQKNGNGASYVSWLETKVASAGIQ